MEDYRLMCLGNGISNIMAECDAEVFADNWSESRGCMMEMMSALLYHKPIIALDENGNVIGRVNANDLVFDENGNIIGRVLPDGTVIDLRGDIIGNVKSNGSFIDLDKKVSGYVLGEVAKNKRN
jgi:sporulation protein YlmC with PRC-barrel domain